MTISSNAPPVILIGYMGSGKSAVGKLLAEKLAYRFIDLDEYIERREGATIDSLFQNRGEVYFRKKEAQYLQEVVSLTGTVIALGGGTPCYGTNMNVILERTPMVFYLKASVSTLLKRLEGEVTQRPLIKGLLKEDLPEFIRKHLFERNFFYLQAPHSIVVDELSVIEVAGKLIEKIAYS